MSIKESKNRQIERLDELSSERGIEYSNMEILLNSVKTKQLFRRNNYHQEKINDVIVKSIG